MATWTMTKGQHGSYAADGLGEFRKLKWWSFDSEALIADGQQLHFRRTKFNRLFVAEHDGGLQVGTFDHQGWQVHGPLSWQNVSYEFGTASSWRNTYAISRHGETLVTYAVKGLAMNVEITLEPGSTTAAALPQGLLVFGAWIAHCAQRDKAAASA